MFRGLHALRMDPKGRMLLPARLRAGSSSPWVLTIDTEEPCLLLYPMATWEEIEKELSLLPSFDPVARRIQRLLMGHATELEVDAGGRILLPPLLRDYAELEKDLVCVGQGKKIELWSANTWQLRRAVWLQASQGQDSSEALAKLSL